MHIEPYDFSAYPGFSEFASGMSSSCLEYDFSYTPNDDTLFSANAKAYLTFSSLQFDETRSRYSLDYTIDEVTSSYVRFKICKIGDSRILRLKGNIIIISAAARGKLLNLIEFTH